MTTTICFASEKSIPPIAFVTGTKLRSRAKRALRLRSPRDTPLALPTNVLLLRWDTKPDKRIRRTFLRHGPTRRTSFMPMAFELSSKAAWRLAHQPATAADPVFQDWSDPAREREKLRTASGDVDIEDSVTEPYTVSASFVALK